MSPQSARAAEALGYTNVKVYHEGIPVWNKKNPTIISAKDFKEAWVDKELSYVLLDIRPAKEAQQGFIKGAVSLPADKVKKSLKSFPDKKLNPPIIIYDATGSDAAKKAASQLIAAGYTNVKLLTGGLNAWTAAHYPVETAGTPTTKIVYTPKPKPGEILPADFLKLAAKTPDDVLIIDVRNPDEVGKGMIKGAKNIPVDAIPDRLAEIPKDKEVVIQCNTGVRAEMGYNLLKDKGYTKIRYLNATIDVDKNGKPKITN